MQAGVCDDNADCPPGAPVCHVASGECVVCLGEDGCSNVETCRPVNEEAETPTHCVYDVGFCGPPDGGPPAELVGACPGDRICRDPDVPLECHVPEPDPVCPASHGQPWVCSPSACDGDRLEATVGPIPARWRTYTGLIHCDAQADTFVVLVPAGASGRATIRYDPTEGGLSLQIQEAQNPGVDIDSSTRGAGVEIAEVPPAGAEREINVVVGGRPGHSVAYSLTLER